LTRKYIFQDPRQLFCEEALPMESRTLQVRALPMVCQLVVDQSPWAHHGLGKFASSLDQAPQTLAKRDSEQIRSEILLR
jgi:hypothetical protein